MTALQNYPKNKQTVAVHAAYATAFLIGCRRLDGLTNNIQPHDPCGVLLTMSMSL